MSAPGNTVSDQIIAIRQSGQNQQESEARIQSLLSQSMSESATTAQGSMEVSQNMEKINDLLVSLHESGGTLTRSFWMAPKLTFLLFIFLKNSAERKFNVFRQLLAFALPVSAVKNIHD